MPNTLSVIVISDDLRIMLRKRVSLQDKVNQLMRGILKCSLEAVIHHTQWLLAFVCWVENILGKEQMLIVSIHWHETLLPSGGESCLEYPAGNIAYPQYCIHFVCAILHIGGSPILCIITVSSPTEWTLSRSLSTALGTHWCREHALQIAVIAGTNTSSNCLYIEKHIPSGSAADIRLLFISWAYRSSSLKCE